MSSYYEMLGVERNVSARALKKAYERKMDTFAKNPDPLQERIVKDAFGILSNPVKRADYDSRLGESEAMPAGAGSGTPLLVGFVVVALTAAGIGYFLFERTKDRTWMQREEQRAADHEKAKRKPPPPDAPQPAKK